MRIIGKWLSSACGYSASRDCSQSQKRDNGYTIGMIDFNFLAIIVTKTVAM